MTMRATRGFKFDEFDALCGGLDEGQLQLKWQHYTRALSAASTSTAVAALAAGPTGGVSMIGAMIAGPLIHNARRKRQIIEGHMRSKGVEPETRNKDMYGPMGFSAVLGGATMGVGSVGAELLAADTMTKVVSHAAIDAGVTAAEDKHSRREHDKEMGPEAGHERYPLLKEYLVSMASRARLGGGPSEAPPGAASNHGPHHSTLPPAAGRKHEPASSPSYTVPSQETAFVAELEDTSPSWLTSRHPVELDSTPLMAPSGAEPCVVSPLSPPSSAGHWPSPSQSLVSELEDTSSPGSSTYPTSAVPSELPGGADTIMSSLLEAIGETTMSELEADLECAVVGMDNPETLPETLVAPFEKELEARATNSTPADRRMSRTFELPSDLDSLVRRHSARFNRRRRASQRGDGVRHSQYSFVEGEDKLDVARLSRLRSPLSQAEFRTAASPARPPASSPSGGHRMTQENDSLVAKVDEKCTRARPQALIRASSDAEPLQPPAYSTTDAASAPAPSSAQNAAESHSSWPPVRGRQTGAWLDEKRQSTDPIAHSCHPSSLPFSPDDAYSPAGNWVGGHVPEHQPQDHDLHTRQQQGESSRGVPAQDAPAMYTRNRALEPRYSSQGSPSRPTTRQPSAVSVSLAKSRAGSLALSAHEGMKKVGYFGLEPATKLAVGGSLLLVGVRPSVQRKYLDKAKSKMGLPVEEKASTGLLGGGEEFNKGSQGKKHGAEDGEHRDYVLNAQGPSG